MGSCRGSRLSKEILKLDRQLRTGMATAVIVRQHKLLCTVRRPGSLSRIAWRGPSLA